MADKFYMLMCKECTPMLRMPFESPSARGAWASGHTSGTGHNTWHVWEETPYRLFNENVQSDINIVDLWLDDKVSQAYKDQPLAQDWARVCKETEERGESIAELILATGQNPRKPQELEAMGHLLKEMADRAWTSVFGIQHFTKDAKETERIMTEKLATIRGRVPRGYVHHG